MALLPREMLELHNSYTLGMLPPPFSPVPADPHSGRFSYLLASYLATFLEVNFQITFFRE